MHFHDNKVSDINIAYIGGGSRNWAWTLMNDLALEPALSGTVRLFDINQQAAVNNAIIGNRITAGSASMGKWQYLAAESLEQALGSADFVVISILPGTFREMRSDVHAPEAFGIYQPVGDTVGPGGILRALRTLPIFKKFAAAIRKTAPGAWVINYTNPMTLCTRILYEVFPQIKAFGCCHEVFHTQHLLSVMLEDSLGIKDISRQEIKTNVLGINHFTWIDKASYRNINLLPLYKKFVEKYYESGFDRNVSEFADHKWDDTCFTSAERVKFDLFRRYGVIAAAGDRHLAEFVPPWYLKDPDTGSNWKFKLTPVSWRIEDAAEKEEKALRLVRGDEKNELKKSNEEGISLIKALLGLGDMVSNVNLPNHGQMTGFPAGAVVETNALFTYNSVIPLAAGRLPDEVQCLVMRQVLNQEGIIRAVLQQDLGRVLNVFCNDPLVGLSLADTHKLFRIMRENTRQFLPEWCLGDI